MSSFSFKVTKIFTKVSWADFPLYYLQINCPLQLDSYLCVNCLNFQAVYLPTLPKTVAKNINIHFHSFLILSYPIFLKISRIFYQRYVKINFLLSKCFD